MKIKKIKYILIIIIFLLFLLFPIFLFIKSDHKTVKSNTNNSSNFEFNEKLINLNNNINKFDDNFYNLNKKFDELKLYLTNVEQTINELKNQTPEGRDNSVKIIINLYEIRRLGWCGKDFSKNLDIVEKLTANDIKLHDEVIKLFKYKDNLAINYEIKNILSSDYSKVESKFIESGKSKLKKILLNNVKLIKTENLKSYKEFIYIANDLILYHNYNDLLDLIKKYYSDEQFTKTIKILEDKIEFEHILDEILNILYIRN